MVKKQLLEIIKCVLNNDYKYIQIDDWDKLLFLAKSQGVLPCVAFYAEKLSDDKKPDAKILSFLKKILFQSAIVSETQLQAVEEIQNALEKSQVYSVRLKGSCTKLRYSSDVLRTMGDIDILYKPEQHKKFREIMENELHYGDFEEGRKNDTYSKKPHLSIEAHRELVASSSYFAEYYSHVWDRCVPVEGYKYRYQMTIEDEYIYNFIHLTEHFKNGGIGVRFIMDIFIYSRLDMNFEYVERVLKSFDLLDFYKTITHLSNVWFGDGSTDETLEKLTDYIFAGGIFGNAQNADALAVSHGGKFHYLMKTIFPPFNDMVSMFTWLKGKKFLLPVAWIIRIFKSFFKRRRNVKEVMSKARTGDASKGESIKDFYVECGFPPNIFPQ